MKRVRRGAAPACFGLVAAAAVTACADPPTPLTVETITLVD